MSLHVEEGDRNCFGCRHDSTHVVVLAVGVIVVGIKFVGIESVGISILGIVVKFI